MARSLGVAGWQYEAQARFVSDVQGETRLFVVIIQCNME